MRKLLTIIACALVVLSIGMMAPAAAAPVIVVQSTSTLCSATCTFTNPPANGNIVVVTDNIATFAACPTSITDSNSVALSLVVSSISGLCVEIWAYIVHGSPTATFTRVGGSSNFGMVELGNADPESVQIASYGTGATTATTGALAATLTAGGIMICDGFNTSGTQTLTSTVGTLTLIMPTNQQKSGYVITGSAVTAGTATCTNTGTTSNGVLGVSYNPVAPVSGAGFVGLLESLGLLPRTYGV